MLSPENPQERTPREPGNNQWRFHTHLIFSPSTPSDFQNGIEGLESLLFDLEDDEQLYILHHIVDNYQSITDADQRYQLASFVSRYSIVLTEIRELIAEYSLKPEEPFLEWGGVFAGGSWFRSENTGRGYVTEYDELSLQVMKNALLYCDASLFNRVAQGVCLRCLPFGDRAIQDAITTTPSIITRLQDEVESFEEEGANYVEKLLERIGEGGSSSARKNELIVPPDDKHSKLEMIYRGAELSLLRYIQGNAESPYAAIADAFDDGKNVLLFSNMLRLDYARSIPEIKHICQQSSITHLLVPGLPLAQTVDQLGVENIQTTHTGVVLEEGENADQEETARFYRSLEAFASVTGIDSFLPAYSETAGVLFSIQRVNYIKQLMSHPRNRVVVFISDFEIEDLADYALQRSLEADPDLHQGVGSFFFEDIVDYTSPGLEHYNCPMRLYFQNHHHHHPRSFSLPTESAPFKHWQNLFGVEYGDTDNVVFRVESDHPDDPWLGDEEPEKTVDSSELSHV